MKKLSLLLLLILAILNLTACGVSPEEKELRRANAFDIEGKYSLNNDSTTLTIKNESDRSNILGIINRTNFTASEVRAFDNLKISLNDVEKFRTTFSLGKGVHNWLSGGENISDDFGNSSKMFINTSEDESVQIGDGMSVKYSVNATISKSDFILRGTIVMTISRTSESNNEIKYEELSRVEIPFSAKNNSIYSNQFFGNWSGKITTDDSKLNSQFSTINIRKIDESNFEVFALSSQFELNGEIFKQVKQAYQIEQLIKVDFPEIKIEYVGSLGSKIEVLGNVYALGMYYGVITKIDSKYNVEQIGNFQYKKI